MLPTACVMTAIRAINNHYVHPDIYVTVTRMRNEAFKSEGNLLQTGFKKVLFGFVFDFVNEILNDG